MTTPIDKGSSPLRADVALLGLAVVETLMSSRLLSTDDRVDTTPASNQLPSDGDGMEWLDQELTGALAAPAAVQTHQGVIPAAMRDFLR